jgi:CBS domain-containing protein
MSSMKQHIERFYSKKVTEIMYTHEWDLPIIEQDTSFEIILSIMYGKDRVWVVDNKENRKLIGVITEKTLLDVLAPPRVQRYGLTTAAYKSLAAGNVTTAKNFMVTKLVTCSPELTVQGAILRMQKYRVRHLPIVDKKGKLVGELDIAHVIRGLSFCLRDVDC